MKIKKSVKNDPLKTYTKRLAHTARFQHSTAQEWTITQLLQDLDLQFVHPWTVHFQDRYYIFDFLITGNLVLECSFSQSCPSKARVWLRSKAILINTRFRALKIFCQPPPFTLMLLEGACFSQNDLNSIIEPLYFTDKLVTSVDQFQEFLQEWKERRRF